MGKLKSTTQHDNEVIGQTKAVLRKQREAIQPLLGENEGEARSRTAGSKLGKVPKEAAAKMRCKGWRQTREML